MSTTSPFTSTNIFAGAVTKAKSEILSNWVIREIRDIALKVGSGSTPRGADAVYKPTGVPLIRSMNVHFSGFRTDGLVYLDAVEAKLLDNVTVKGGDVLLNITGASIGRVTVAPNTMDGARVNQHVCIIRPNATLLPSFLAYFLASPNQQERVLRIQVGATRQALTKAMVLAWNVPVPPLHEQHRIVAKIEKQFTRLDAGLTSLGRIQVALKRYRASVLKAACEGRLTFTKAPVTLSPLRDLITDLGQGWSPKCELNRDPLPGEWAIIKTTAVQSMKYFDRESKPLPQTLNPRPGIEIKVGDFLMTRKGPRQRAGVTCLVRATRERLMVCDTVYRFRCRESSVNPAYLELALNSPQIVSEIDRRKSGINDSGVSLTHEKLGGVLLPIPPLAEQECIVAEVERRLSVIDEMEGTVTANVKRAERLRQSILHLAFRGKLMGADIG